MLKLKMFFALAAFLVFSGCDIFDGDKTYPPVQEGLISLDAGAHTYMLYLPPGFRDDANYMNLYPLVIGLHGGTSLPDHYYVKDEVKDARPCVYFAPNNTDQSFGGTNAAWVRQVINSLIENKNYKIDRNRIYIIGYSMGAMGTTYLAQDLYDDYGYLTAAIVPAEGGVFSYITSKPVRDHIACWFHLGGASPFYNLDDYNSAREYYQGALAITQTGVLSYPNWDGTIISYNTTTYTLKQIRTEIFKSTTYADMGHSDGPVFKNPAVIEWLFSQNAADRYIY